MVKKEFSYGAHSVKMETGRIARQADAAVLVDMSDTTVLVTVVGSRSAPTQQAFFPLTVNYQERTYSAGKVPGGFFKREGRPSEKETLVSRLIDRPLRPLFPRGFLHDVQVIATVMSLNPDVNPDIPAMLGAAAAVELSGLPYNGPLAAARVGYVGDGYLLNPDAGQMRRSALDLIVAGTEDSVLMVESGARFLSEKQMLGAIVYGHRELKKAIAVIREMSAEAGKPKWDWQPPETNSDAEARIRERSLEAMREAYAIPGKQERHKKINGILKETLASLADDVKNGSVAVSEIEAALGQMERQIVRDRVLAGERRMDGRDTCSVRPLSMEVGMLPRAHGSALFTRGETQAIVATTLGTGRDAQIIDAIEGERKERFMLHYNFPPYCVGETGFMGSPKRREIGHGNLARRALQAVMPGEDEFAYVLRVVSEITESNGSSSMATVCGTSLSLMNAGVPIKAPVAGVAMGLILEGNKFAILTDILGDEDHLGDMDFKVAGTAEGITALQMDMKITQGIGAEVLEAALEQARDGRLFILGKMNELIQAPGTMSPYAPRIYTMHVKRDKISDVIGKGGATIRALTEETGTTIDIDDDGRITIASCEQAGADEARRRIEELTADAEIGKIYNGKVDKIMDFGAFVTILPGRDGLVHISQISNERIKNVESVLQKGDNVRVKVIDIDRQGRIRLSMKEVSE